MILLTIGTYPLQFDRLVEAVDTAVRERMVDEEVFAQVGVCKYKPKYMKFEEMLEKNEFDAYFRKASCIVGHAGMGTISMSLDQNKPLLVMARMAKYNEHVNDHQVSTAEMFEHLGHVLLARTVDELPQKIGELKTFVPAQREATPQLVSGKIAKFLRDAKSGAEVCL
jgi:UDP-N-acetylglucosamine transferase subunit ALG13